MNDLTLMLAGAQLGITACTFALGAITKPAVDAWLGPVLLSVGPARLGRRRHGLRAVHVLCHLPASGRRRDGPKVLGHRAPGKVGPGHRPDLSRLYLAAAPAAVLGQQHLANRLVKASGVEPVEKAAVGGQDTATIRQLVEHSGKVGTLEPRCSTSFPA